MITNPLKTDPKTKLDSTVIITAKRITIRMSEISWSELATDKWFPTGTEVVYLQKSDSPRSHFKNLVKITPTSFNSYIDNEESFSLYRTGIYYYRIVREDASISTQTFTCEKPSNLYGSEIIHRHSIQLKEGHSGNPMYLFIKNRSGKRCPECWDEIRSVRTKTNCKTCMNTGYIQGYCDPICVYVSVVPEQATVNQEVLGTSIDGHLQGWTVAYPRINLGDVLVDPATQDIWCVGSVSITTHKRTPTKQELVLDRHNEDTEIMRLLSLIPAKLKKEDMRQGEFIY